MDDYSHTHPRQTGNPHPPIPVMGEHIGYVMLLLADPMEERHIFWQQKQDHEADIAELRRTRAPGYEHG